MQKFKRELNINITFASYCKWQILDKLIKVL